MSIVPLTRVTELLAALRGILKTHVAKLAEENWMFEPEDILRG
jgi:hypothetical protein